MTRSLLARLSVPLAVVVCWAAPAGAQAPPPAGTTFTYDLFSGGSQVTTSSLTYTPGVPLTVQVYVRQTAGAANFLTTERGLAFGGARLTFGSTPGVLSVSSASDIRINTGSAPTQFDDAVSSNATRVFNANFAQFTGFTEFSDGALPDASGRVLLGEIAFQTSAMGGTTTLDIATIPIISDLASFQNLYELDGVTSPLSFTVTPVPEPGLTLAVGLLPMAAVAVRRRLRRGAAPASPAAGAD